jgi:hypothetical protein
LIDTVDLGGVLRGPAVGQEAWVFNISSGDLVAVDPVSGLASASYNITEPGESDGAVAGQQLNTPLLAPDGSIWVVKTGEVFRFDPGSTDSMRLHTPVHHTGLLTPINGMMLLPGIGECIDNNGQGDPEWLALGVDVVYFYCDVISWFMPEGTIIGDPIQIHGVEWLDPERVIPIVSCLRGTSTCRKDEVKAEVWYAAKERLYPRSELYPIDTPYAFGLGPTSSDGNLAWVPERSGVVGLDALGPVVSGRCPGDDSQAGMMGTVADGVLWIVGTGKTLCATQLSDSSICVSATGPCSDHEEAAPVLEPTASLPLEEDALQPVASGYGNSVWVPLLNGSIRLFELTDGATIKVAAEYVVGQGLAHPAVAPDGSLWVPSQGRVTRLRPAEEVTPMFEPPA